MIFRTRSATTTRRIRKFSPASLGGQIAPFSLERRNLARPSFYMAGGAGIVNQVGTTATNGADSVGINVASSSGSIVGTAGGGFLPLVTFSQTGLVTDQIVDPGVVGTPTQVLSMSVTQDHQGNVTNNPAGLVNPVNTRDMVTTAAGNRTYRLADDGVAPVQQPTTLRETLQFTLARTGAANVTVTGGMNFTGFGFSVAAAYPGLPQLTATAPGTVVTTNTTAGVFNLTATTRFPNGLPLNPGGNPVPVTYFSRLDTTLIGGNQASSDVNISMNYGASFMTT